MGALELHIFKFTSLVCLLLVGDWAYIIKEQFRFRLFYIFNDRFTGCSL